MRMAIDRLLIKRDVPFHLFDVSLDKASDMQLQELSKDLGLNLSLDEMKRVRERFRALGEGSHRR